MTLTAADIAHVAVLARLGLSEEERKRLGAQLAAILDHISRLDTIDTSHVAETAHITGTVNVWREDEPEPSQSTDAALRNAPDHDGTYFRVGAIQ